MILYVCLFLFIYTIAASVTIDRNNDLDGNKVKIENFHTYTVDSPNSVSNHVVNANLRKKIEVVEEDTIVVGR